MPAHKRSKPVRRGKRKSRYGTNLTADDIPDDTTADDRDTSDTSNRRSPERRSRTPSRRRSSARRSRTPSRRSPSPRRRTPSPRRDRSPTRRRSPPRREDSPSPTRRTPSPRRRASSARRRSPSPRREPSARRRSPQPERRVRSARPRSPERRREPSARRRSPPKPRTPSPPRRRPPSPKRFPERYSPVRKTLTPPNKISPPEPFKPIVIPPLPLMPDSAAIIPPTSQPTSTRNTSAKPFLQRTPTNVQTYHAVENGDLVKSQNLERPEFVVTQRNITEERKEKLDHATTKEQQAFQDLIKFMEKIHGTTDIVFNKAFPPTPISVLAKIKPPPATEVASEQGDPQGLPPLSTRSLEDFERNKVREWMRDIEFRSAVSLTPPPARRRRPVLPVISHRNSFPVQQQPVRNGTAACECCQDRNMESNHYLQKLRLSELQGDQPKPVYDENSNIDYFRSESIVGFLNREYHSKNYTPPTFNGPPLFYESNAQLPPAFHGPPPFHENNTQLPPYAPPQHYVPHNQNFVDPGRSVRDVLAQNISAQPFTVDELKLVQGLAKASDRFDDSLKKLSKLNRRL